VVRILEEKIITDSILKIEQGFKNLTEKAKSTVKTHNTGLINNLFFIIVYVLIISLSLISCKEPDESGSENPEVTIIDISQNTNWDYMVVGNDMSSFFVNIREDGIPTDLYYKPEIDSDKGFTFLFKDNGLPDRMIYDGYIMYFSNFNGYNFDIAVIYPDGTIEYYPDNTTDTNWDTYDGRSIQGRGVLDKIQTGLSYTSKAIGLGTCVMAFAFPPLVVGCVGTAVSSVASLVANLTLDDDTSGFVDMFLNGAGCISGGILGIPDCINFAIDTYSTIDRTLADYSYNINLGDDTFRDFYSGESAPPPALTGTVTISGTNAVYEMLTANTSNLGGSGNITYNWHRNGNFTTISIGTNKSNYWIEPNDAGSTIFVTVSRSNNSGRVTSSPTYTITEPILDGEVTINGTPQVGQTLTVRTALDGRGVISYQWKRRAVYGTLTNIGTNSPSYTVQTADVGSFIIVDVRRSGYFGAVSSEQTAMVTAAGSGGNENGGNNGNNGSGSGDSGTLVVNNIPMSGLTRGVMVYNSGTLPNTKSEYDNMTNSNNAIGFGFFGDGETSLRLNIPNTTNRFTQTGVFLVSIVGISTNFVNYLDNFLKYTVVTFTNGSATINFNDMRDVDTLP
jgi:hypothetical protein